MDHGWLITKDHICNGTDEGTLGPCDATLTADEIRNHPKRVHFKMYDDDGELYYEGYNVESDESDDPGFEPLDHFGMPNAGCTELRLRSKSGTYETL
jgi:hypothetical protein